MTDEIVSTSPQQPDDVVARVPAASPADVAAAADRARPAQQAWRAAGAARRAAGLSAAAAGLRERRAEATQLVVREVGKPAGEAAGEVARSIAILDYYAQACFAAIGDAFPPSLGGLLYSERRPRGVAGLITPWNFPLAIPLWKAAPALATGNSVLLKPSPESVGCAQFLADLLGQHLPDDVFTVLPGGGETGQALVEAADVVSFTGSAAVGRSVGVAAARRGVPAQCEMGGQNAAIVLPDADPEVTAAIVAGAAMGYAGQKCTATRRVITVGEQPELREALAKAVDTFAVGNPADDGVAAGPLITESAQAKLLAAVEAARAAGGRVLAGGGVPDRAGWFVEPTLVDGVPPDHELACEETFGPLALVLTAAHDAEAIRLAGSVRYGLVTSVHGRDVDRLLRVVSALDTGLVKVNAPTTGVDFYAPFGGEKDSSFGPREQGTAALEFYTSVRTVTFAPHGGSV